jgi:nucleotide-binding universal stress UspA family protein
LVTKSSGDVPVPNRISTIVVGLDGSLYSERALYAATPLAEMIGARLFLLSTVAREDECDERIRRLASLRPRALPTEIDVLPDPDPADAINSLLRDLGDAVACVASHGRGRSAAFLGSVANDVIGRRPEPTIVVGPSFEREHLGRGIVACIDEKPSSTRVLPVAAHWSQLLGSPLTAISVAESVPPLLEVDSVRRNFGPDDVDHYLEEAVRPVRAQGYEIETKALYDPISPAFGLRRYLWEHATSLVAVSTQVPSGIRHPVLSHASAALVRQSLVPMLMVPSAQAA